MSPELSVVMPAYNEEANLAGAVDDVLREVFSIVADAELIIVDDGSRDGTAGIVEELARREPRIRLVRQSNAGHGPALVRGLRAAAGRFCLLMDSDRQIPMRDFACTWSLAREHGVCIGIRQPRRDPWHRLLLSRALGATLRAMFGAVPQDANVPYKLIRRDRLDEVLPLLGPDCHVPSVLICAWLATRGYPYAEQRVEHRPRAAGEAHLKPWRLVRFCAAATRELFRFRRRLRRTTR